MRNSLLIFGILVMVAAAHAATYEWVDSQGVTHFTDDPDKVPVNYRYKTRQLDTTPVPGDKEKAPPRTQPQTAAEPATDINKARPLFGGHNETWWRTSFKTARDELKTLQDNLTGKKDKLNVLRRKRLLYSKHGDRTAYYELSAEIEKDEARIKELQNQLTDLDAEAAKSGVSQEWRQ